MFELLSRHKLALAREFGAPVSGVLTRLSARGVLTAEDERRLRSETDESLRGDRVAELFAEKGFNAFRELCVALEMECPHLLTSLVIDNPGKEGK